jgi:hypothetical protein
MLDLSRATDVTNSNQWKSLGSVIESEPLNDYFTFMDGSVIY